MDFSQRKLSKDALDHLRICPIHTVKPFALMMAPAYVYMKLNEKYVMVKGALDFFTEEELNRLKPFGSFFFPQMVDKALEFRKVAREVRELLQWRPDSLSSGKEKSEIPLPPASFETSDAVIRVIAPLWEPGLEIDPFFVAVFTNELCDLLPGELLKSYRDQNIVLYERAIVCSSWAVFLALHLGYTDLPFLSRLRLRVMEEVAAGKEARSPASEINELVHAARLSLGEEVSALPGKRIEARSLTEGFGRTSRKFSTRIQRVGRLSHV